MVITRISVFLTSINKCYVMLLPYKDSKYNNINSIIINLITKQNDHMATFGAETEIRSVSNSNTNEET